MMSLLFLWCGACVPSAHLRRYLASGPHAGDLGGDEERGWRDATLGWRTAAASPPDAHGPGLQELRRCALCVGARGRPRSFRGAEVSDDHTKDNSRCCFVFAGYSSSDHTDAYWPALT